MVGKTAVKDNSLKSSKFISNNKNYNLKNKLIKENKVNKEFLEKLRFITLEEIITLKLLVSTESLKGKLSLRFSIFSVFLDHFFINTSIYSSS